MSLLISIRYLNLNWYLYIRVSGFVVVFELSKIVNGQIRRLGFFSPEAEEVSLTKLLMVLRLEAPS